MIELDGVKYNTANIAYAYKKDEDTLYLIVYVSTSGSEIKIEYDTEQERDNAFDAITF